MDSTCGTLFYVRKECVWNKTTGNKALVVNFMLCFYRSYFFCLLFIMYVFHWKIYWLIPILETICVFCLAFSQVMLLHYAIHTNLIYFLVLMVRFIHSFQLATNYNFACAWKSILQPLFIIYLYNYISCE